MQLSNDGEVLYTAVRTAAEVVSVARNELSRSDDGTSELALPGFRETTARSACG